MVKVIPSYALYGEQSETCEKEWGNFFNLERLPDRSGANNWKIPPHIHKSLIQLLFIQKGSAEVFLNSAKHNIKSPALLLIPAGTAHSLNYTRDVDGPSITASQGPIELTATTLIPNCTQLTRKPAFYPIDNEQEAESIMKIYLEIERELNSSSYGNFAVCVSLFTTLLIRILRISKDAFGGMTQHPVKSRKSTLINKFLALIASKEKAHVPVEIYASEVGVTTGQLTRLCREVLGVSSMEVINTHVIQNAQRDLIHTSKSIKQLADSLGFSDEAYFTRFFKKHIGLSPKQFRELSIKEFAPANTQDLR